MDVAKAVAGWADGMRGRPWAWGECDCNTVVLSWLDVLTLGDYLALALRRYSDEASARAYAESCGHSLESLARAAGGVAVVAGFQQPGDIILVALDGEPWQRGHVCVGTRALSALPDIGVVQVPLGLIPALRTILRVPCRPRS
jgi:hypothetical protein